MARTNEPPTVHGSYPTPASFNDIRIEGIEQTAPMPRVGDSLDYTFILENRFGDPDSLTDDNDPKARHERFEEYAEYAGQFEAIPLDDGTHMFTEEAPAGTPSLLARLDTAPESDVTAIYGLIEAVETGGPILREVDGPIFVDVTLFCLAPLSAYRDRDDLRNELEFPGL